MSLEEQIAQLRVTRNTIQNPDVQRQLDAAITALEELVRQQSLSQIQSTIAQYVQDESLHEQVVGGNAHVGAAISGDINNDIQTGGIRNSTLIQQFFEAAGTLQPSPLQHELLMTYLKNIINRYDRLRLAGVVEWERKHGQTPAFSLSQVYIALAATTWVVVELSTAPSRFRRAVREGNPDIVLPDSARRVIEVPYKPPQNASRRSRSQTNRYRLERPLLLTQAVSARKHVVLLGGPGSGKSSFLRHLAVAISRHEMRPEEGHTVPDVTQHVPIYASLGRYATWLQERNTQCDSATLWNFLLADTEHDSLAGLANEMRSAFRNGRLLLLLDGVDEVAELELREEIANAVVQLGRDTESAIVVSCRTRSYTNNIATAFEDWGAPIELAPFSGGQVRHFIHGWYQQTIEQGLLDGAEAKRRAEELIVRLQDMHELGELWHTPLLLTIITILHYYEGRLPEDRVVLYENLVELLLTRWTQHRYEADIPPNLLERLKRDGKLGGLRDYHIRNLLESLAFRAHEQAPTPGRRGILERGIVREELIGLFEQFDLGPGPANEKATIVLDYLEDESGLLQHEGDGHYTLPHLTYQEYLAACHLAKQKTNQSFNKRVYDLWRADPSRWREVIFLAVGRMVRRDDQDTAAAWLQFLVAPEHGERRRDQEELHRAARFGVECLANLGGKVSLIGTTLSLSALWDNLAESVRQLIEGNQLPATTRVQFGVDLARWGDPRHYVCSLPPAMITIPSGTFTIGESREAARSELQANDIPLSLQSFAISRYLVTNAQFALFLNEDGCDTRKAWWSEIGRRWFEQARRRRKFWNDWLRNQNPPNYPVVGMSWHEANAFCQWITLHKSYNPEDLKFRLPTEAEWEYAARGTEGRRYSWGNTIPNPECANYDSYFSGLSAVGCFGTGATPEGLLDLAGNVWEWTGSRYAAYPYNAADGRERFDQLDDVHDQISVRGGSWDFPATSLRASSRLNPPPGGVYTNVGFRVAHSFPSYT